MKICYCLATTDLEGGARSLIDLLSNIIKNKKIKPYVVLTKKHKELENILKKINVEYIVIYHGTDCKTKNKLKQLFKLIFNKYAKYKLKKYIKIMDIDIVHNNSVLSLIGMEAAYELNIPYICHVRESIESGLGLKMMNYKKLYDLMNKSVYCIYISDSVKKRYEKYVNCNYEIIYDGLDVEKYIIDKNLNNINFNELLMVGRISKEKGQIDAIKALDNLVNKYNQKYYLTIIGTIGDNNYYKFIKEYIRTKKLENNIKILPYSNSLCELRKKHNVALVCSENEGLGRVTVEAMLSQQLVIGANAGATAEIINDNENGYLYELHNSDDLADIILNINKDKVKKIIENGYNFAINSFDNDKEAKKVEKLYYNIIRGSCN